MSKVDIYEMASSLEKKMLDNSSDIVFYQKHETPSKDVNGMKMWSNIDGRIIPVSNTFASLESGYYTFGYDNSIGTFLEKQTIKTNKLYRLPNEATNILLNDIDKFWTLKDTYKKYNRVFRRNYLLYSAPGTGKTSVINLMCQDLIEKYNGIVITLRSLDDIYAFIAFGPKLQKIETDRKIILIAEDIDNFIKENGNMFLNFLDGNYKFENVVTIATTNYIERLEARYTNRPTRFDRVIEFPLPNEESRRIFIEKSVLPEDISKIDIDKWVEKTKGYSIDHINELILLVLVFGHDESEAFETMSKMVNENSKLKNSESIGSKTFGFGI